MATVKEMRTRIGSVKSTQKITKALQMVAAAKLRRAQAGGRSRAPLCPAHGDRDRQPGGRRLGPVRAAAAGRHRQGPAPSRHRRDLRSRPGRRLQLQHRARRAREDRRADRRAARTSRSSPSAARRRDQLRRQYGNRFVESYEVGHQGAELRAGAADRRRRSSSLYRAANSTSSP